jgi:hypothetical protein
MQLFLHKLESSWYSFLESEGLILDDNIDQSVRQIHICYSDNDFNVYLKDVFLKGSVVIAPKSIINKSKHKFFRRKIYNKFSLEDYSYVFDNIEASLSYIDDINYGNGKIYSFDDLIDEKWGCSSQINRDIVIGDNNKKTYSEKLCLIDKRNLRKYMRIIIKLAANSLDMPFVYIWKYPKLALNVFNLRIDVDPERTQSEHLAMDRIKKTFDMSYPWINSITFAINFYRRAPNYSFFKKYIDLGFDIQSHNFFHLHYPFSYGNKVNIGKAHEILSEAGIKPIGFISPEYFWYNEISDIIESYKYKYSASFGFDYSNYPYRPFVNGSVRKYFEISSDPLVYSKIIQNHAPEEVLSVYKASVSSGIADIDTPCFKYEHPAILGGTNDVFNTILMEGHSNPDVLPVRLSDFSEWLEIRNTLRTKITYNRDAEKFFLRVNNDYNCDISEFSIAYEKPHSDNVYLYDIRASLKNGFDVSGQKYAKKYKHTNTLMGQSKYNQKAVKIDKFGFNTHTRKILQGSGMLLKYQLNNFYL